MSIIWGTFCTTLLKTPLMSLGLSLTCRKANYLLHVFAGCDPLVKTKLIVSHCLSLYGCVLWRFDCKKIKSLEIALNNILQKIRRLPRRCHTGILHCVANINSVYNLVTSRFSTFLSRALNSDSLLIRTIYQWPCNRAFTAPGFNSLHKHNYVKVYSCDDRICTDYIRDIRLGKLLFESSDTLNTVLYSVCCD